MKRRPMVTVKRLFAWASLHRLTCCVHVVAAAAMLAVPSMVMGSPQAPAAPQDTPVAGEPTPPPALTGPRPQEDTLTAADAAPGSRNVTVSFSDNFIADRLP